MSNKKVSQFQQELRGKIKEIDLRLAELATLKRKAETELTSYKLPNKNRKISISPKQAKITIFLKSSPKDVIVGLLDEMITDIEKLSEVSVGAQTQETEQNVMEIQMIKEDPPKKVKVMKVKSSYSEKIKTEVKENLLDYGVHVFLMYEGKIPHYTLVAWRNSLKKPKKAGIQGRKTPFNILEEELLSWFLTLRARKIFVTSAQFKKKALKIKQSILEENDLPNKMKHTYKGFTASDGWLTNFKNRYSLVKRTLTTKCTKTIEELRRDVNTYFINLQSKIDNFNPIYIYNMDEMAIFFEMDQNYTLEIKGKKCIGKFSSGKDKERLTLVVTACSDGRILPAFMIFKASKPRNKTFEDDPPKLSPNLPPETELLIKRAGVKVIHNYSGWMNKRTMVNHYLPYLENFVQKKNYLFIFDNCSAHVADATIEELTNNKWNYMPLAPNTTPICQPIDISVGRSIEIKIRNQFENWLIEKFDFLVNYNEEKNKYTFQSPTKSLIIEWIIKALRDVDPNLVKKSN